MIACSATTRDAGAPVPALATSPGAAEAFSILRRRWAGASREERIALEQHVGQLRALYADEPVARVADVYLAWIALERGDLGRARALAIDAERGFPGNTRDLGALLDGAALSRQGDPEGALERLMPLVGKLLDPYARELLHQEAVDAAAAANRFADAVRLLDAWMRDAPEEEQATLRVTAARVLETIPAPTLERALREMVEDDELGLQKHADALEKAIARRLAAIALSRGDAELARRLVRQGGALATLGEVGADVVGLAASGADSPSVLGRRVGLVLSAGSEVRRTRSADVALGVLQGLGLTGGGAASGDERLAVRDDGGAEDGAMRALSALAVEGASVVVGGVDRESATRLADAAEVEAIPVLLLSAPESRPRSRWAIVLGPDEHAGAVAVVDALAANGARTIAVVGASRALVARGNARVLPAVDCVPFSAGGTRYPVGEWQKQHVDALLLAGDARCTEDALGELRAARFAPALGLGPLAVAAALPPPRGVAPFRAFSVAATVATLGCFPDDPSAAPATAGAAPGGERETARSWWAVVARDAARLARASTESLPDTRTREPAEIRARRERVLAAIASAKPTACLGIRAGEEAAWGTRKVSR